MLQQGWPDRDPTPPRSVADELAVWHGRPKGLSRAWVEDATSALSASERPAGRLALLTAIASYAVDAGVIDRFRAVQPADDALVGLTSWASLTAARHVAGWTRLGDD
jgi:hypothetical protein